MIQINGKIKIKDGSLEEGRAAIVKMMEASRAEDGCLDYTFAQDLSDPNTLILFERWRDQEALKAHGQSPHMAEFQKYMAANPPLERDLRVYTTDDGSPL